MMHKATGCIVAVGSSRADAATLPKWLHMSEGFERVRVGRFWEQCDV